MKISFTHFLNKLLLGGISCISNTRGVARGVQMVLMHPGDFAGPPMAGWVQPHGLAAVTLCCCKIVNTMREAVKGVPKAPLRTFGASWTK